MRIVGVLLVLGLLALPARAGMVGQKAPPLRAQKWTSAKPPDFKTLKGRVMVIEFWATWDAASQACIPQLNELHRTCADRGLVLLALAQGDTPEKVKECVGTRKISYLVGMDDGTGDACEVTAIPHALVISHEGVVTWEGYPGAGLERAVGKALDAAPAMFLAGVDLGSFAALENPLSGGKDFPVAYRQVSARAKETGATGRAAKLILDTLNKRLQERMDAATAAADRNPVEAYAIFAWLADRFGGIELTTPAVDAARKLAETKEVKDEIVAGKAFDQAETALAACVPCANHTSFRSECPVCVGRNKTTFVQIASRLKEIQQKFGATRAARASGDLLDTLKEMAAK